jgi:hypothetical protein
MKFAQGNPQTGLAGKGNTSSGLSKRTSIVGHMPRGAESNNAPKPSSGGGGGAGVKGYMPRGEGQGQRPTEK